MPGLSETEALPGQALVLSGWRYRAMILTLLIGIAGYLLLSLWVGWDDLRGAMVQFGWPGLSAALGMTMVGLGARLARWQLYLGQLQIQLPIMDSLRIYIGGLALTATPGKAGEAIRGVFLKRLGVDYVKSIAIFFSDRFTDLLAVMLLAVGGIWFHPEARPAALLLGSLIFLILLMIQKPGFYQSFARYLIQISPSSRLNTMIEHTVSIVNYCHVLFSLKIFTAGLLLALLAWGIEAVNLYFITHLLQAEIAFSTILFAYAFAKLVGAISMIPGGLGSTEATLIALLMLNGMDETSAIASALLLRLTTFWFVISLGMLALPKK